MRLIFRSEIKQEMYYLHALAEIVFLFYIGPKFTSFCLEMFQMNANTWYKKKNNYREVHLLTLIKLNYISLVFC